MAKQHRDKLPHISPVWYQLRLQDGAPYLAGVHDADAAWMAELREPTADVRPQQHIFQLLSAHTSHSLPAAETEHRCICSTCRLHVPCLMCLCTVRHARLRLVSGLRASGTQ